MRLLLTRPEADARRSAERLKALGHEVVIAPLFEIVATGAPMPNGTFDRLLATSAQAFAGLQDDASELKHLPMHVVGERTASAARNAGFARVETVAPDATALAIAIARAVPRPQPFLYLAGRERRPELEAALAALGHVVTPWIVYEAREQESAAARLREVWLQERLDAVLHFSPRSAALYVGLADKAGLREPAMAPVQVAISARVAQSLSGAGDVRVAPTPDLAGLIACL
jgi:uroporphyrinogen-III synthase